MELIPYLEVTMESVLWMRPKIHVWSVSLRNIFLNTKNILHQVRLNRPVISVHHVGRELQELNLELQKLNFLSSLVVRTSIQWCPCSIPLVKHTDLFANAHNVRTPKEQREKRDNIKGLFPSCALQTVKKTFIKFWSPPLPWQFFG